VSSFLLETSPVYQRKTHVSLQKQTGPVYLQKSPVLIAKENQKSVNKSAIITTRKRVLNLSLCLSLCLSLSLSSLSPSLSLALSLPNSTTYTPKSPIFIARKKILRKNKLSIDLSSSPLGKQPYHIGKRTLYICKRALYICKRSPVCIAKRTKKKIPYTYCRQKSSVYFAKELCIFAKNLLYVLQNIPKTKDPLQVLQTISCIYCKIHKRSPIRIANEGGKTC